MYRYRIIAVLISINGFVIAMNKPEQGNEFKRAHDEWFHAHHVQHGVDSVTLTPLYEQRHPADPAIRQWKIKVYGLPLTSAKL